MNVKYVKSIIRCVALVGCMALRASAQTKGADVKPPPKQAEAPAGEPGRDPFSASGELQAYASLGETAAPGDPRFQAHAQPTTLPKMNMRGYLKGRDEESVALLEIAAGSTYVVREGDTIGLQDVGTTSVLKIKSIDRLHLIVEVGTLGQVIIVR